MHILIAATGFPYNSRGPVMPRMLCFSPHNTRIQGWCRVTCWSSQKRISCCPAHLILIPLDKIVWDVSELHVNKAPDNTSALLMQKIMEMMGSLDRNTMAKACG
jgi:hypothetical protein